MRSSTQRHRTKTVATNVINAARRFSAGDTPAGRINAVDIGTCTWWRKFPAHAFAHKAALIAADLDRLTAVNPVLRNALRGDVISAIQLAKNEEGACVPFAVETDLVMTALVRCALEGSAAAAVMMANVTASCGFDHSFGEWITRSWFEFEAPQVTEPTKASDVKQFVHPVPPVG